MIRRIIQIDEALCNGCGACASACHEGAIGMVDGKAKLLRDSYCDGLGDCLPVCPTGAITFVTREAAAYDEAAVLQNKKEGACPSAAFSCPSACALPSKLVQWPCQIRLIPADAACFENANLLIAADCTAYAYANIHRDYMQGKVTLIGCPKLDSVDYAEKISEILRRNPIQSITVLRMEVPCCGGLEAAVKRALQDSRKALPLRVETITISGGVSCS